MSIKAKLSQENLIGWIFLLPNLLGFIAFKLVPIVGSLFLSFSTWNLISGLRGIHFIGIRNYANLLTDTWFIKSFENTIIFTFVSVPAAVFLGLVLAMILNDKIYLRNLVRLGFYLPNIASIVAVAVVWEVLFLDNFGPIDMFLHSVGFAHPPRWLTSTQWALPSIIIVTVWQVIGYNAIIFLAGLQTVPSMLYEVADMDGAHALTKFFKITIPMLSPTMFFVVVTSIIGSFQVFAQVNIMTQGGPGTATTVIVYDIYRTAFDFDQIGYANAMGWVLFILVFIFTAIQWKFSRRDSWVN